MKRTPPRHGKLREARDRKKFRKQLDNALARLNASALADGYQIIQELARTHPDHPEVHYAFGAYHLVQLEIDPHYELARSNRRRAEALREGEIPAQQDIPMINYSGDTFKKIQRNKKFFGKIAFANVIPMKLQE